MVNNGEEYFFNMSNSVSDIFVGIANAIRQASGDNNPITPMQMPQKILDAFLVSSTAATPSATLPSVFQSIANSIRLAGGSGTMTPAQMPTVMGTLPIPKTKVEYMDGTTQMFNLSGAIAGGTSSAPTTAITNCANAKKVWIGNQVTGIDAYTFSNCANLQYVSIPSTVTSIGNHVFRGDCQLH